MSLGKAIHELRPDLSDRDIKDHTKKAEDHAKQLEKESKASD
jgi:hypothetical protein